MADTPRLTIGHLERRAELHPDRAFLVCRGRTWTYIEALNEVNELAKALLANRVEQGDRVALFSTPRAEFFLHFLATTSVGAIWVGLNPKYTDGELDHVVGDSAPSMLFGIEELAGEIVTDRLDGLVGRHDQIDACITDWDAFVGAAAGVTDEALASRRAGIDTMSPAFIVYTSGSTGRPKGAVLTHYGFNFCNEIAVERKGLTERRTVLNLPINHVGCISDGCGRTMTGGGTMYFQEAFDPGAMMQAIQDEQLNTLAGVPTMFQACLAHPEFDSFDLTSVDLLYWGGSAIPAEMLRALMEKTATRRGTMGYGMTEMVGGVTYSALEDTIEHYTTTVGYPDERQPIRLWHSDDRICEPGEVGEVQVKGDYVMESYWNRPEATAAAFTPDGWLRSGDIGEFRPDGYLSLVGRMSEMFKSGGYNVYPREVEMALEEHPSVAMAAVVGVPDERFQEVGVAWVIAEDPVVATELTEFCRGRLANYKIPKRIEIVDSLPMLPIGKVDKTALRELSE